MNRTKCKLDCQKENGRKDTTIIPSPSVERITKNTNINQRCLLCLHETLAIVTHNNKDELLNKRSELISKYRYDNKYIIRNYDTND